MTEIMQFPNPEKKLGLWEKLDSLVLAASEQINRETQSEHNLKKLVETDGSLSIDGFSRENGGIYEKSEMDDMRESVTDSQVANSLAYNHPVGSAEYNKAIIDWKERAKPAK